MCPVMLSMSSAHSAHAPQSIDASSASSVSLSSATTRYPWRAAYRCFDGSVRALTFKYSAPYAACKTHVDAAAGSAAGSAALAGGAARPARARRARRASSVRADDDAPASAPSAEHAASASIARPCRRSGVGGPSASSEELDPPALCGGLAFATAP